MANDKGNDLKVIIKAKELALHTIRVTSNIDKFPKKYRHTIVDRMQLISMDIYELLVRANTINNVTARDARCETITAAITNCTILGTYIEFSMNLGLINSKSTEYWSKLVSDVKYLAIGWRTQQNK